MNFTYNYNHYHLHQHSIIHVGVMQRASNLTYTKVKKITFLQRFMYILFWASLLCIFHNFDTLPTSKMSSNPWLLAFLQKFKKIGNVKKAACTDKKCCFWFQYWKFSYKCLVSWWSHVHHPSSALLAVTILVTHFGRFKKIAT